MAGPLCNIYQDALERAADHERAAQDSDEDLIAELKEAFKETPEEDFGMVESDPVTIKATFDERAAAERELDVLEANRLLDCAMHTGNPVLNLHARQSPENKLERLQSSTTNNESTTVVNLEAMTHQVQTLVQAPIPRLRYDLYQISADKIDPQHLNAVISHYPGYASTPSVQCYLVYDSTVDGYRIEVQGRPKGSGSEVYKLVPDEVDHFGVTIDRRFSIYTTSGTVIQVELYTDEDVVSLRAFLEEPLGRKTGRLLEDEVG